MKTHSSRPTRRSSPARGAARARRAAPRSARLALRPAAALLPGRALERRRLRGRRRPKPSAGLEEAGLSAAEAQAFGKQLAAVETDLRRLDRPAAGVAVFRDRADLHVYGLPREPARCVVVAENFALRPLLAAVHHNRRHHVLALSTNRVALFEGDSLGLEPILAQGVPASLEDALGSELSGKELRVATTQGGAGTPKYYSHDSGRDERKLDLERFHLKLARAIEAALAGPRGADRAGGDAGAPLGAARRAASAAAASRRASTSAPIISRRASCTREAGR